MIRVVLFDLGNVLIRFIPGKFWDKLDVHDEETRARLGPKVIDLGRKYESGTLDTPDFLRELYGHLKTFEPQRVDEALQSVLPEPIPEMEEVVRDVAQSCGTGLVSNTNPLHLRHCLRIGPALRHIQRFYLSYDLKVLKPAAEFYAKVLHREGTAATDVAFIDDLQENVDGAIRAGMNGIRFSSVRELRKELGMLDLRR